MDINQDNKDDNNDKETRKEPVIKFKKIKKKPLRSKIDFDDNCDSNSANEDNNSNVNDSESNNDEGEWGKLEKMKLIRSLKRKMNKGINAVDLLTINNKESQTTKGKKVDDGGLMTSLDLANTFSVETNRRDEDQDMLKFIEEQLAAKKGIVKEEKDDANKQIVDPDDLVFNQLPEHLLKPEQKKNEEMLSNQMLSGIPEVDLGIDEKIRNIEATEEAKMKLLEKKYKRSGSSKDPTLVPTNIAANYVQHNRFNIENPETSAAQNKKPKIVKPVTTLVKEPVVVIGDEPKQGFFRTNLGQNKSKLKFPGKEKATDDYHFEKFKKQFRK